VENAVQAEEQDGKAQQTEALDRQFFVGDALLFL
jgi:hypothetical protein